MKSKIKNQTKSLGLSNIDILKIREIAKSEARKTENQSIEKSFLYMLAIPLNVLVTEEYWGDKAKDLAPDFIEEVLNLYESVQNGYVGEDQLAEFLEDMAGVKITADWLENRKELEDE